MIGIPQDLPIVERDAVRFVIRDSDDRILLFHTQEITAPELGSWWELPGGGMDEGESYVETTLRELREETGIRVLAKQVGRPIWRRTAAFRHRHLRHVQHELIVEVQLGTRGAAIDDAGQLDYEKEDYFEFRWWPIADIVDSDAVFYPRNLPALLPRFLAGEEIDEPFELWS